MKLLFSFLLIASFASCASPTTNTATAPPTLTAVQSGAIQLGQVKGREQDIVTATKEDYQTSLYEAGLSAVRWLDESAYKFGEHLQKQR
jgi:hypothetical protein